MENLFGDFRKLAPAPGASLFRWLASVTQMLMMIDFFRIHLIDLTRLIVTAQCGNVELQDRGIRAADSLHITTALAEGAELLITTDANLIHLNNVFENSAGASLRCVDTDQALALLP